MLYAQINTFNKLMPVDLISQVQLRYVNMEKRMLLRKGKRWMPSKTIVSDSTYDNFIHNTISVLTEGQAYKIPRIIKRIL